MRSATRAQSAAAANASQQTAKQECIKVVVRCRPLSEKELADGNGKVVVELNCKQGTVQLTKPLNLSNQQQQSSSDKDKDKDGGSSVKIYTFDSVYDGTSEQAELYADIFHPLVDSVLSGFNGTIFAYGQTGTGKTFTMEGTAEDPGVIPRSFTQIFSAIGRSSAKQFLVRSSYLEIYQESIRDLLATDTTKRLALRERPDTGVYVEDLSSFVCKSVSEIERVLVKGRQNRAVGATNMNEHSSRSHAIFLITIEHSERDPATGVEHIRVGKLNLVDLAGSERLGKTQTAGKRAKEGITINLSLSALSNVISALVDGRTKRHIPYRDSKLTRLLQDSLGGNARTVMVANIGPSAYNYEETLTTLRYASRAKNIQNKPRLNEDPKDTLLKEFQAEIERLRLQLEERRRLKLTASSVSSKTSSSEDGQNDQEATMIDVEASERLQARIRAMESKMLVGGKNIVDHTNEQQRELETRMDQLREQRQRERAMVRQLEEQEEATQEVRETFTSLQQEVEMKRRKLRKVVKEFQSINSEIRDLHETANEERRELERISSDLMRDLKLRYLIIDNFIPESEKTRFLRRIYYDENDEEWHVRPTSNSINSNGRLDTSSTLSSMAADGGEEVSQSRLGTASSSRPSSAYYSSSADLSSNSRLFLGFQVPFHVGPVDHLGLYMPERTTLDYNEEALLATFTSSASDDDGIQIEIIDIDELHSDHHQEINGGANRSTTAASSLNRRTKQSQPRGQFNGSGNSNWNDMAVGKTPPPMRRSLTVMNNYHHQDDIDGPGSRQHLQLDNSNSSNDINSLLDLKRATVRRTLCSSLSNHVDRENHLNLRPDTAFPRSRGLVPK